MKLILSTILFSLCALVFAQEILKIEYVLETELDENYDIKVYGEDGKLLTNSGISEQLKAQESEPKYYNLLIRNNESLFIKQAKINNSIKEDRIIFIGNFKYIRYFNTENQVKKYETEEMNTNYLVLDTLETPDWQIFREKDKILNYEVRKATWQKDSTTLYTAWFAPKFTYKTGPDLQFGLPGLILKIEERKSQENWTNIYTYRAINIGFAEEKDFEIPEKGEIISAKNLHEMQKEHWEKRKEMMQGGVDVDD